METFILHPDNPAPRTVRLVAERFIAGAVVAYPTDSVYGLGCYIENKQALSRIRQIRGLEFEHFLTLMCRDLSEIANFAEVSNSAYRIMRRLLPGSYTFVLPASREVPKRLQHPKRKTIGIRVPDNAIIQAILTVLNEPIITTSLQLPDHEQALCDPHAITELLSRQIDVLVDGGLCGEEFTTVIDLTGDEPVVLREGKGSL